MATLVKQSRSLGLTKALAIQALLALLVTLTAVGLGQSAATAAPAPAAAVAVAQQALPAAAPVAVAHSADKALGTWSCDWYRTGNNVDSYCSVSAVHLRQWAYCSGWGYIYSPWVYSGSWHLWTYCNGYTLTSWGYQYY
jgi:hypothetical protein